VGLADGIPVSVGVSVFPHARFPGLGERLKDESSISKALATFGLSSYRRRETRILTRMPTADEARHLKQPSSQPVLVTEAVDVDPDDRPIRLGITCFAGSRVQITVGETGKG
jgi:GntR family phosphonate transport system transcriptional regulator